MIPEIQKTNVGRAVTLGVFVPTCAWLALQKRELKPIEKTWVLFQGLSVFISIGMAYFLNEATAHELLDRKTT